MTWMPPWSHSYRATAGRSTNAPARRDQPKRRPAGRARQRQTPRPSYVRLLYTAGTVLAATWLPGVLGAAPGLESLGWWGRESGYLGLSWLVPAFLIGIAADRAVRRASRRWHTAAGWLACLGSASLLLVGAAQIIGG